MLVKEASTLNLALKARQDKPLCKQVKSIYSNKYNKFRKLLSRYLLPVYAAVQVIPTMG